MGHLNCLGDYDNPTKRPLASKPLTELTVREAWAERYTTMMLNKMLSGSVVRFEEEALGSRMPIGAMRFMPSAFDDETMLKKCAAEFGVSMADALIAALEKEKDKP